jgi:outer membrane biosynthesis protein TonB
VGDGADGDAVITMDLDKPLVCMLDMDCLLHEVEEAAAAGPPAAPLSATPPTTEAPPATPSTTEAPPATPSTTEAQPATPPTTEPPPPPTTTTTAPPPPPTTTTTAPPPPDPPPAETMGAPTGDTDGARTTAVDLTAATGGGTGS